MRSLLTSFSTFLISLTLIQTATAESAQTDKLEDTLQPLTASFKTKFFRPLLTNYLQGSLNNSLPNKKIEAPTLLTTLGADDLHTVRYQSQPCGKTWHSTINLHTTEQPTGAFSILSNPTPTLLAPAGTDIAAQISLDAKQLQKLAVELSKIYQSETTTQTWLDYRIANKSLATHLSSTETRIHLAIDFDDKQTLDLGRVAIGRPHIFIRFDGANSLVDAFFLHLKKFRGVPFHRIESHQAISYRLPAFVKDATANLLPYVHIDKVNNTATITSTEEFFVRSQATGTTITEDPNFQSTWKNMPATGSAMLYVSKRALNSTATLYKKAIDEKWTSNPSFLQNEPLYSKFINDLNNSDNGFAFCISPSKEGQQINLKGPLPGAFLSLIFNRVK